ncbi:MAG TPA: 3',5'-cyclic-nucleotide phosphodiesterase [Blastocatellia bacterium]|nr:3',5'-cyclic-nucleotide phosphodiesterase [Blastocatellia bacterium]
MGLSVKLLSTSHGSDSQLQPLTTFLIDGHVTVDAGSLGLGLAPEQQGDITDVIITHPHQDHTASLPIHIAEAFTVLKHPITVHGTESVIEALRMHTFNDNVWPDFTKINLIGKNEPTLKFSLIEEGVPFQVGELRATAVPVNHIVPTIGVAIEGDGASVVFTSDTYKTDKIWDLANSLEDLKAVFIDCSFPNELAGLAEVSKHLTPELIAEEMNKLKRPAHVFAVHIKPQARERVLAEIRQLNRPDFTAARIGHQYTW